MRQDHLFTSERLGFRNWVDADILPMSMINADPAVMEFFPSVQDEFKTRDFVIRMQLQLSDIGFCYFAVDRLDTHEFIGFIGLSVPTFDASFTPCVDMGWRLAKSAWNNGFATEGAKRCLEYGFSNLGLDSIVAICPAVNTRSANVMQKIGMQHKETFMHPLLPDNERLQPCMLYEAVKP